MNERNDKNVFLSELEHKTIGFHEQFPNGLVTKLRHGLTTIREFCEGNSSFMGS